MSLAEQPEVRHTSVISVPEPNRIQIGASRPEQVTVDSAGGERRRQMRLKSIYGYTELQWSEFMPQTILREAGYNTFERSRAEVISVGGWLLKLSDPAVGNIFARQPIENHVVLGPAEGIQIVAGDSLRDTVRSMYVHDNRSRLSIIVARETAEVEGVSEQAQYERRRIEELGEIVAGLLEATAMTDKIDRPFFRDIGKITDAKDAGGGLEAPMTPDVEKSLIDKALADLHYRRVWQTADPLSNS